MNRIPDALVYEIDYRIKEIGDESNTRGCVMPTRKMVNHHICRHKNYDTIRNSFDNGAFIVFVKSPRLHLFSLSRGSDEIQLSLNSK